MAVPLLGQYSVCSKRYAVSGMQYAPFAAYPPTYVQTPLAR